MAKGQAKSNKEVKKPKARAAASSIRQAAKAESHQTLARASGQGAAQVGCI